MQKQTGKNINQNVNKKYKKKLKRLLTIIKIKKLKILKIKELNDTILKLNVLKKKLIKNFKQKYFLKSKKKLLIQVLKLEVLKINIDLKNLIQNKVLKHKVLGRFLLNTKLKNLLKKSNKKNQYIIIKALLLNEYINKLNKKYKKKKIKKIKKKLKKKHIIKPKFSTINITIKLNNIFASVTTNQGKKSTYEIPLRSAKQLGLKVSKVNIKFYLDEFLDKYFKYIENSFKNIIVNKLEKKTQKKKKAQKIVSLKKTLALNLICPPKYKYKIIRKFINYASKNLTKKRKIIFDVRASKNFNGCRGKKLLRKKRFKLKFINKQYL